MSDSEREIYKLSSKVIFVFIFAVIIFHAFIYVLNCAKEIVDIFALGERYSPPSVFIELTHNNMALNVSTVIIIYGLLPTAFMCFNLLIVFRERSKLLIIFPICGIASELAQLAQECGNYDLVIQEKMSYVYAIIGMDILSALLIIAFFAVMIKNILHGYSISQGRWLIVAGFVFVFARILIKMSLYDDEPIPHFNELKGYLFFSATLLNAKKRLITSKTL